MTKKALERRINQHLEQSHGYILMGDGKPMAYGYTVTPDNFQALNLFALEINHKINALLSHLGLEVKQTDAVPAKTVLVKKQRKGKGA